MISFAVGLLRSDASGVSWPVPFNQTSGCIPMYWMKSWATSFRSSGVWHWREMGDSDPQAISVLEECLLHVDDLGLRARLPLGENRKAPRMSAGSGRNTMPA